MYTKRPETLQKMGTTMCSHLKNAYTVIFAIDCICSTFLDIEHNEKNIALKTLSTKGFGLNESQVTKSNKKKIVVVLL